MGDEAEFDAMEAAFRDTARGRWFLDEWARRVRHGETATLLGALDRIERAVSSLAVQSIPAPESAPAALPDIDATLPILEATERVQEIAWDLREQGVAGDLCDRLDAAAADIYAACAGHGPSDRAGPPADSSPLRDAEERPQAASRSTHHRPVFVETPAARAPQDDEGGGLQRSPATDEGSTISEEPRPAPAGLTIADLARTLRVDDADGRGIHERLRV